MFEVSPITHTSTHTHTCTNSHSYDVFQGGYLGELVQWTDLTVVSVECMCMCAAHTTTSSVLCNSHCLCLVTRLP